MTTQLVTFSSLVPREVFQSGSLNDQAKVDLKEYFIAVKTRYESGEEYPYDLEELIPTVYPRKDHAVRAIEDWFTQGIDFISSPKKGNEDNPKPPMEYRLSPFAFEFVAARKNKDIFGLYHRVFHARTEAPKPKAMTADDLAVNKLENWIKVGKLFEAPLHLVQQEAVKAVQDATGVDYTKMLAHSPAQSNINEDEMMLEVTEIAIRFGWGKAAGWRINEVIRDFGWQKKINKVWIATEIGAKHSAPHAWKQEGGTKAGYNLKWNYSAVKKEFNAQRAKQGLSPIPL